MKLPADPDELQDAFIMTQQPIQTGGKGKTEQFSLWHTDVCRGRILIKRGVAEKISQNHAGTDPHTSTHSPPSYTSS